MDNKELNEDVKLPEIKDENKNEVANDTNSVNEIPELPKLDSEAPNQSVGQISPVSSVNNDTPADFSSIFNLPSEENQPQNSVTPSEQTTNSTPVQASETNQNQVVEEQPIPQKNIKKEDIFNGEVRTIYEIKPEKEGNPIVVVLFFICLIGVIFSLPYISKKFDWTTIRPAVKSDDGNDTEEDEYYFFNKSSVRAKLDGLEFTNFVKSLRNGKYYVTFNITNTNDKAYLYDQPYYVVFYEGEHIVYYALIHSYNAIGSNAVQEITLDISEKGYNSADRFKIEKIEKAQYPDVRLIEKEGEYDVLTCKYQNDEIKYYFIDNKLSKVKETYNEELESNANYQINKANYKALSDNYKKVDNFTSNFIETNTDFTMINEFNHRDIPDVTMSSLKTYKFFRYNETKNIVSFEAKAQGYNCS